MTDYELLRRYVDERCDEAFTKLVTRHMALVYSAALRQTGDRHQAEEIAQGVFVNLSRSAHKIKPNSVLAGWLLTAVRYLALDAHKLAARRKKHERKAAMNKAYQDRDEQDDWEQIAPVIDEAMAKLKPANRDALLLRYFENQSIREVASALQINEEAARQRLSRGVQQLRALLLARGVRMGAVGLMVLIGARAVAAYPTGLIEKTVSAAVAALPVEATFISGVFQMIAMHKIKAAVLVLAMVVGLVVTIRAKEDENSAERAAHAQAILKKARASLDKADALSATLEVIESAGGRISQRTAKVNFRKPNLAHFDYINAAGGVEQSEISDGRQVYIITPAKKEYHRPLLHGHTPEQVLTGVLPVLAGFWNDAPLIVGPDTIQSSGSETVDGQEYDVVRYFYKDSTQSGKVYFSRASGLLSGWMQSSGGKDPVITQQWLKNIKLDPPLEPSLFSFDPLAVGYKEFERSKEFDKFLVPVGQAAPEFTRPDPKGNKISLADLRKGKKAVLINFWFCECSACRHELPQLQFLYNELKAKGLEVVAIDNGDTADAVSKVAQETKLTFPIVLGGPTERFTIGRHYGVEAYPTNFLIDSEGKVLWRGAGFEEREVRNELRKAGIE